MQGRADSGVYWSGTETHWLLVDTRAMRCDLALTGSPGPGQKPGDLAGGCWNRPCESPSGGWREPWRKGEGRVRF